MRFLWYNFREQILAGRNRWALWFPVAFACGIAFYFSLPVEPSKWLTLSVLEILVFTAILFRYRIPVLYALVLPAFFAFGFTMIQLRTIYLSGKQFPVPQEKVYLTGRIEHLDYNSRGNQRLILTDLHDFNGKEIKGRFRISEQRHSENLSSGQCVELIARLLPRPQAVLPGGYQFDRKSFYLGLSGSGYAESAILPLECPQKEGFFSAVGFSIDHIRKAIIHHIKRVLPVDEASVATAIMAGEQGGINSRQIQDYRDSGLAHFLSISGLHMSMIAGLMFCLIRLLVVFVPPLALRYNSKKLAACFAIVISLMYLLISGAAIPAQRAFIMTFIVLLGILFDRRAISMQTIAWAAFVVLLISPEALIGASFQMSFAAVVALVAFYEQHAGGLQRFVGGKEQRSLFIKIIKGLFLYVIGIFVTDLLASFATLPFAVYHFNRIALYTSVANLLAGPIIGLIIMPFTLLSLLLMPMGLDIWSLKIVGWGISLVNQITTWVSHMPEAGYPVLSMPAWGLGLIVFGGLWLAIWQTSIRHWGWILILCGWLSLLTVKQPDVLINWDGSLIAVQDKNGRMVVLPSRGNNFTKEVWLNKTASAPLNNEQRETLFKIFRGEKTNEAWLQLKCGETECAYKDRVKIGKKGSLSVDGININFENSGGAAVYLQPHGAEIITVKDYIGKRLWN